MDLLQKKVDSIPAKTEQGFECTEGSMVKTLQTSMNVHRVEGAPTRKAGTYSGTFRDPQGKKIEELFVEPDLASRTGMTFVSDFILAADVLLGHHQQLPEEEDFIPNSVGLLVVRPCCFATSFQGCLY